MAAVAVSSRAPACRNFKGQWTDILTMERADFDASLAIEFLSRLSWAITLDKATVLPISQPGKFCLEFLVGIFIKWSEAQCFEIHEAECFEIQIPVLNAITKALKLPFLVYKM